MSVNSNVLICFGQNPVFWLVIGGLSTFVALVEVLDNNDLRKDFLLTLKIPLTYLFLLYYSVFSVGFSMLLISLELVTNFSLLNAILLGLLPNTLLKNRFNLLPTSADKYLVDLNVFRVFREKIFISLLELLTRKRNRLDDNLWHGVDINALFDKIERKYGLTLDDDWGESQKRKYISSKLSTLDARERESILKECQKETSASK